MHNLQHIFNWQTSTRSFYNSHLFANERTFKIALSIVVTFKYRFQIHPRRARYRRDWCCGRGAEFDFIAVLHTDDDFFTHCVDHHDSSGGQARHSHIAGMQSAIAMTTFGVVVAGRGNVKMCIHGHSLFSATCNRPIYASWTLAGFSISTQNIYLFHLIRDFNGLSYCNQCVFLHILGVYDVFFSSFPNQYAIQFVCQSSSMGHICGG